MLFFHDTMLEKDYVMSIKKVVKYGEPSLRQPSKEVHKVSQKIKVLVEDLLDTM